MNVRSSTRRRTRAADAAGRRWSRPARFWVLATLCLAVTRRWPCVMTERWTGFDRAARARVRGRSRRGVATPIRLLPRPSSRPSTPAVARLEVPANPEHDAMSCSVHGAPRRSSTGTAVTSPRTTGRSSICGAAGSGRTREALVDGNHRTVVDHDLAAIDAADVPRIQPTRDHGAQRRGVHRVSHRTQRICVRLGMPQMPAHRARVRRDRVAYQDLVGHMFDGDRITRWHTGGRRLNHSGDRRLGSPQAVSGVNRNRGIRGGLPRFLIIDTPPMACRGRPHGPVARRTSPCRRRSSAAGHALRFPVRRALPDLFAFAGGSDDVTTGRLRSWH